MPISFVREEPRYERYYHVDIGIDTAEKRVKIKGERKKQRVLASIQDHPPITKRGKKNSFRVIVKVDSEADDKHFQYEKWIHNFDLVAGNLYLNIKDKSI